MIEVEIDKDVYLECYHHLLEENDVDIEIIWGGRDSGKSQFVAQYLTEQSMSESYFRCILIKQTHESVKDAQWQMIKDVADEWQVSRLFNFKSSPLGINNVAGATFLTRGMDTPGKIRSITNPSHAWVEEANQISEASFINLLTGLRSKFGRVRLFLTLNPESQEASFEDFWLFKMFFKNHYPNDLNFIGYITTKVNINGKEEEVSLKYRSTHTTYHDNPFVTPQRKAFHESLKESNYYWYNVFTLGLWGNAENDSPWAFAFSRAKHVARPVADPNYDLILSFDFNRNPMACSVIQFPDERVIRVIKVYKLPNMGVSGICDRVLVDFPNFLYVVTGDYSGATDTTLFEEQVNNYTVIRDRLSITDNQIQIQPNPRLQKNRTLVNLALQLIPHEIHEEDARPLIWDMENVRANGDGTIDKGNGTSDRKDPKKQADSIDTYRYFINKFVAKIIHVE